MAATLDDLRNWFDLGKAGGATHMIVVCDTFDYGDYPVYVNKGEDAKEKYNRYKEKPMQRVMEVYDLSLDKANQMAAKRVFNF